MWWSLYIIVFGVRVFVYTRIYSSRIFVLSPTLSPVVVWRTSRVRMDVECVAAATIYLIAAYNYHVNMVQWKVVEKRAVRRIGRRAMRSMLRETASHGGGAVSLTNRFNLWTQDACRFTVRVVSKGLQILFERRKIFDNNFALHDAKHVCVRNWKMMADF